MAAGMPKFNMAIFTRAARALLGAGKYEASMLSEAPYLDLVAETNRVLTSAVNDGITDNIPTDALLRRLRRDVFLFSGFKTHQQLTEASALLLTDGEKIKPWNQFRRDIQKINKAYNEDYLEAEYQFATGSVHMASAWEDHERTGDRYNLQYRTAGDDKVRDSHRAIDLVTLPVSDPFWRRYYPPNGWRCRCTAVRVRIGKYPQSDSDKALGLGDKATTSLDKNGNNRDAIFRFNPGIDKIVFPAKHPYRKVQDGVAQIIEQLNERRDN